MYRAGKHTVLDRILTRKREEVKARRVESPVQMLREMPIYAEPRRGFRNALEGHKGRTIVAEVKRASPSRGPIRPNADAAEIAGGYERGGAAAVSVLTDGPFFAGSVDDLGAVRRAVRLPLLRKDFLIDPYQVEEARAAGADAILVIVAATERAQRVDLVGAAHDLGLDVLVEVHDAEELETALMEKAGLIGINNRNLETFVTSITTSERLLPRLPSSVVTVCESGLHEPADLARLEAAGAGAFLIGEALLAVPDPAARLREFLEGC